MEKTRGQKSRATVPLNLFFHKKVKTVWNDSNPEGKTEFSPKPQF